MERFHQRLVEKGGLYAKWHQRPYHGVVHLAVFTVAAVFVMASVQTAFAANNPIGNYDTIKSNPCSVQGWAFDRDAPNAYIKIHVYKDGPYGSQFGRSIGIYTANKYRPDVGTYLRSRYGIAGAGRNYRYHGFNAGFNLNDDAVYHSIYVYAINQGGGSNVLLGSKSVKCYN